MSNMEKCKAERSSALFQENERSLKEEGKSTRTRVLAVGILCISAILVFAERRASLFQDYERSLKEEGKSTQPWVLAVGILCVIAILVFVLPYFFRSYQKSKEPKGEKDRGILGNTSHEEKDAVAEVTETVVQVEVEDDTVGTSSSGTDTLVEVYAEDDAVGNLSSGADTLVQVDAEDDTVEALSVDTDELVQIDIEDDRVTPLNAGTDTIDRIDVHFCSSATCDKCRKPNKLTFSAVNAQTMPRGVLPKRWWEQNA